MPDETTKQPDPAPWYVREIRVYGAAGFAAVALGWFGLTVYKDNRATIEKQDAQIQRQAETTTVALQNNTEAISALRTSTEELRKEIQRR